MRVSRGTLAVLFAAVGALAAERASAQERIADSSITYQVQNAVRADPRVGASSVTVTTDHGIVTLAGDVSTLAAKEYAVAEAKKIDGVLGVIDDVVMTPTGRPDAAIVDDVLHGILKIPAIEAVNANATCKDGIVTLTGKVATAAQRQEATLLASEVPGVREVRNRLALNDNATARRTDEEIRNDATSTIERDVFLTGMPVSVHVVNGKLSLDGAVGTAYQRRRAADDVRVLPGVKDLANNLRIEWWEKRGVRDSTAIPEDRILQRAARAALNEDYRLDPSRIVVLVSHGEVTLEGIVPNAYQRQVAARDAKDLVGVAAVNDNLFVRTAYRGDESIREDVDYALQTDRSLHGFSISADVRRGIVALTGTVDDLYQQARAGYVASRTPGVRRVVNNLEVNQVRQRSDLDVAGLIRSRLEQYSVTAPVADQIRVTVRDGDALLTGNVGTFTQASEAANVAYTTIGVRRVENRLVVTGYNPPLAQFYYTVP